MSTNPFFKNFTSKKQQYLAESLVLESIKRFGHTVKYIPRTVVSIDPLFNEASNSSFNNAVDVEVYIKNIDGFAGQGRYLSNIGIEVRDQITFSISKYRFLQLKNEKLTLENSYTLQTEDRPTREPEKSFSVRLEDENEFNIDFDMPREGDLIYMPLTGKLFEIKFVNWEAVFYQTGSVQFYDLECELYEYASEDFNTGDAIIDDLTGNMSSNMLDFRFVMEDGKYLLFDDFFSSGYLITEEFGLGTSDPQAQNELFDKEIEVIIDWSEKSPLVAYDEYGKW